MAAAGAAAASETALDTSAAATTARASASQNLSARASAFKPKPVPQWFGRWHHFPALYVLNAVAVYAYIQSETAERLHHWLLHTYGAFVALIGFGTALFLAHWHVYGALQALMDAYPHRWWAQFKGARLDSARYSDVLPNVLWNQLVMALPVLALFFWLSITFLGGRGYDTTYLRLPLPTLALQVMANYVVYEALFYWSHRLLHTKPFYRFHKQHHMTYGTLGVSGSYMSTVDFVLTQMIPIAMPPVLLGSHFSSMWFPLCIGGLNSIQSHGCYYFPLMPSPDDHLTHHLQPNRNFGTGLFDWLCGTD